MNRIAARLVISEAIHAVGGEMSLTEIAAATGLHPRRIRYYLDDAPQVARTAGRKGAGGMSRYALADGWASAELPREQEPPQVYQQRYQRQHKFGLSPADYARLLAAQDGLCAVCGDVDEHDRALAVDHDHQTGVIRGLLCTRCNLLVGHIEKARPGSVDGALRYLAHHGEKE